MKDKKQDEISLEELVKAANATRDFFTKLGDELSKVLANIKVLKEDTWEMKCPYKKGDEYYLVDAGGSSNNSSWDDWVYEKMAFNQGNIFKTKEAAKLEAKRRNLLTRFRAFRDECNGDWKADWCVPIDNKYFIFLSKNKIRVGVSCYTNPLSEFGYFKHFGDCKKSIRLFGDEIKALFVDCEE